MAEQSKPESGAGPPATSDVGGGDLSALWPLLHRIRAVEIKFEGDGSAPPAADLEVRLKALEDEVAALGKTVREALGAATNSVHAEPAAAPPPPPVLPQSWSRAVSGAAVAVALLLLAHALIVFVFDLSTVVLRLVSIVIPLLVAVWMTLRRQIRPWLEVAMAVSIGLAAVSGMSYVTAAREHSTFLPDNAREWRETLEYVASIAFAYGTGVMLARAVQQARAGASNRTGQVTRQLAEALAAAVGTVATKGPQIKKHVELIQGLINTVMLLATGFMAIVTGLRSVIH
ncbi:MAG TPA: hypothetical protein VMS64_36110 [Candidatus Methylomirabilis sp.]|nr:hypothetical protein [Candidatus Methylomirabilis sp.]